MVLRIFEIAKDIILVLAKHDRLERQDIKTGLGIYPQDDVSHVHIPRIKQGEEDAGRDS